MSVEIKTTWMTGEENYTVIPITTDLYLWRYLINEI